MKRTCGKMLIVLCTCLIKQILAEALLLDDILHEKKMALASYNVTHFEGLQSRMGESLYGNFAPNKSLLWFDENGNPEMQYHVEPGPVELGFSLAYEILNAAMGQWSKYTCLTFKQVNNEMCSKPELLKHGMLHVSTFFYKCCSSSFGDQYWLQGEEKSCQKMCIDYREQRCNLLDIRELVSYTLGLLSPMNRPDRDDHIAFHPEQMDIEMWPPVPYNHIQRWRRMSKCPPSQVTLTAPVPFDMFSSRNPVTGQYVEKLADFAIVVTRDRRKQYLLEHRLTSCPDLSHLDVYQVNKQYGCDKIFEAECLKSVQTVPKCLNFGYLKKDCTCACPTQYTGARCETKTDAHHDYCFKNVWFLDISNVTNATTFDTHASGIQVIQSTGTGDAYFFNRIYANQINQFQYLTITIHPAEHEKHVSVSINFTEVPNIISRLESEPDRLMQRVLEYECGHYVEGFALLWGAHNRTQLRVWCFTSFFLNEPDPMVLRSRVAGSLDMLARSAIALPFREPQLSVDSLLMRLEVTPFDVMIEPEPELPAGNVTGPNNTNSSDDDYNIGEDLGSARALLSDASPTGVVGAGAVGLVLLAGIVLLAVCDRYCNKGDGDHDGADDAVSLDRFDSGDDDDDYDSD